MLEDTRVPDHFVEQAGWCADLGSPFTAALLRKFAEDFDAGGPIYDLCKDWDGNPRKDALALRIAGALHHAVLTGDAPELAAPFALLKGVWLALATGYTSEIGDPGIDRLLSRGGMASIERQLTCGACLIFAAAIRPAFALCRSIRTPRVLRLRSTSQASNGPATAPIAFWW